MFFRLKRAQSRPGRSTIPARRDRFIGGIISTKGTSEAVWVIWSVFKLFDSDGSQSGIATVSRDITERRNAEKRLQASELGRRLALDTANLGTWNIDPETNTLVTDDRFRNIFHGSSEPVRYERALSAI